MAGRPARLQLGSVLRTLGTPGPGAAVAPVSATMLLNKAVGTETKGLPVSRNVMHAGDVAEQPGSTRPGALAVTWSSATCQPPLDAVGTLRAAKEVSMLLVHKIPTWGNSRFMRALLPAGAALVLLTLPRPHAMLRSCAYHVRSCPLFLMAGSTAPIVRRPALLTGVDGRSISISPAVVRSVRKVENSWGPGCWSRKLSIADFVGGLACEPAGASPCNANKTSMPHTLALMYRQVQVHSSAPTYDPRQSLTTEC